MARPRWALVVLDAHGTARVWRLGDGEVRLGRDASCTVRLDDAAVSGMHLRLLLGADAATAIDPGSRHGTFHEEVRLPIGEPWGWAPGAALRLGPYRVELHREGPGGFTTESGEPEVRAAALQAQIAARHGLIPPAPEPSPELAPAPLDEPSPAAHEPSPAARAPSPAIREPSPAIREPSPAARPAVEAPPVAEPPPLSPLHRLALLTALLGAAVAAYALLRAALSG